MAKLKIKSEDIVIVIAGDHKGMQGKVVKVLVDKNKAIVEGVNKVSRHTKPSTQNPKGGIINKEAPIHISNLSLIENGVAVRATYKWEEGKKIRVSKKTHKAI